MKATMREASAKLLAKTEPYGDALDKLSKHFGEIDLYVGDDGKIHQS